VKSSTNKGEPSRDKACVTFSERWGGLLAHVECIPDCGLDDGYYLSRDHGSTWKLLADPDPEVETGVRLFGNSVTQDRVRYRAVASGYGIQKQWLLERSNDYGKSWDKRRAILAKTGLRIGWFVGAYYSSANPEIIYATVPLGQFGDPWDLFESKDGGDTFSLLVRDIYDFAVSRTNPRIIYATSFDGGILKSVDSGLTWSKIGQKSFSVYLAGKAKTPIPMMVQVDPSNGARVFVLSSKGLHRSEDEGVTWCRVDLGIARQYETCSFVIDPHNSKRMFLGTWDWGMFKSDDGGCNWEAVDMTRKAKK
jgi:hypothetical protein